uniref:Uncharacterized protein n=1 Tax=Timema monikensis TaxID=170555 RepID=A0A7R9EMT7_9NEOP|nr:unnamed protein product [Timema monikensis]
MRRHCNEHVLMCFVIEGPSSKEGPPHISKTPSGHDIYIGLYTDLKRRMAMLENTTNSLCEDLENLHDNFADNFHRASLYTQQLNEMIALSLKKHQNSIK